MTPENPYVGPRPFERDDAGRFYGRERDVRDLASMIIAHRVVLLYSASGAGKSSLVNAGVVPLLERKGYDVLPVARVGVLVVEPPANVFAGTLAAQLGGGDGSISDALKTRTRGLDDEGEPIPSALVVDQFEELFTAHPEHWSHRAGFFERLREALVADEQLRVLFVLREEYLARLEPYGARLPGGLKMRFRLERLDRDAALDAVTRPLEGTGRSFAPGVAEGLVDDLLTLRVDTGYGESVEVPGEFVEPVHLQVVCSRLWAELPPDVSEIRPGHVQALADLDTVLARFYEEALAAAESQTKVPEQRLRRWVHDELITPGGTRSTAYRGRDETAGLPNAAVEALEDKRLVRAEQRAGALWYELTHDRLITPIRTSNERVAAHHRRRRRIWLLVATLAMAAVFGVALGAVVVTLVDSGPSDDWSLASFASVGLDGPGSQLLSDIAALDDGAVAVGAVGGRPGVWSYDGANVSRQEVERGTGRMNAVAASGETVVAVGHIDFSRNDVNGQVWRRSTGGDWKGMCEPDDCGGSGRQELIAVAVTSSGEFVAVGRDAGTGDFDAAVWRSRDGLSWERAARTDDDLRGDRDQVMNGVVEIDDRLVAIGRSGTIGAAWTSDDGGDDWTLISEPAFQPQARNIELQAVEVLDKRVIAVGRESNDQSDDRAAAWFSDTRGSQWTRATVLNAGFVIQQMTDLVAAPPGLIAVGNDRAYASVWESRDGSEWTAVSSESFTGTTSGMSGVASGEMLFAVGIAAGDGRDGRVWVSEAEGATQEQPSSE